MSWNHVCREQDLDSINCNSTLRGSEIVTVTPLSRRRLSMSVREDPEWERILSNPVNLDIVLPRLAHPCDILSYVHGSDYEN